MIFGFCDDLSFCRYTPVVRYNYSWDMLHLQKCNLASRREVSDESFLCVPIILSMIYICYYYDVCSVNILYD
jgi:hypothetical protein